MTTREAYLMSRWRGLMTFDWYPAARKRGVFDRLVEVPNPALPEIEAWTDHVGTHLAGVDEAAVDLCG